jgi:hypothetical protein
MLGLSTCVRAAFESDLEDEGTSLLILSLRNKEVK